MTHSPGDVAMATSKAEGTGQPHPRSSECKDNDNIQKTRKKMKKNFIQPREITKETLENGKGFPFTYGRVKEVANGQALTLDCEKLEVGHEVFFGMEKDDTPIWMANVCRSLYKDTAKGVMNTLRELVQLMFGKELTTRVDVTTNGKDIGQQIIFSPTPLTFHVGKRRPSPCQRDFKRRYQDISGHQGTRKRGSLHFRDERL